MKKLIWLFLAFITPLLSQERITLDYLKSQPAGITRDFYIWVFLQQDKIAPKEASEAYKLAHRKNPQLFGAYYKKGDNKTLSRKTICQRMEVSQLIKQEPSCIANALTLKKADSLDKKTLANLAKKVQKDNPTLSQYLNIMASPNPFNQLTKGSAQTFGRFYFQSSYGYRVKFLNHKLSKETLKKYLQQNNETFKKMLRHMILTPELKILQASLLEIPPQEILSHLDSEAAFYMGLNAVTHKKNAIAESYFEYSTKHAKYAFNKNRGLFWSYLVTKDKKFLDTLVLSKNVDIYTLAALEMTNKAPQYQIAREVPVQKSAANWNVYDPFAWERIKNSFKGSKNPEQILSQVRHSNTSPHFVWLNKQKGVEYFLTPYREAFGKFEPKKQILLYSLGRQESLFIPTAISTSYALGLMQLMPFNVKAVAKELEGKENVNYFDMFNPNINVPYAEYFTRPIIKEFKHPLFVSYAYNGGQGFLRRALEKNHLFRKDNPLDPWYSMEMIPYEESRVYGKKVLANYVIYSQSFNQEVKLLDLLKETLIH